MKSESAGAGDTERWPVIMFIAGENSGDLHASRVIAELRTIYPQGEFFGYGGDRMEQAGMVLKENLAQKLPIMGFTQVVKKFPKIRQLLRQAAELLRQRRPDLLVLVDYPGFNLRTAAVAKQEGIPVVYYISPQFWAWHRERLELIRKYVDKMLVILPFEADMYREEGINAEFVGHPLQDDLAQVTPRDDVLQRLGLSPNAEVIGLVPGSRNSEVIRHLSVMLEAARIIQGRRPRASFVLPRASTISRGLLQKYLARYPDVKVAVIDSDHKSVRAAMDFSICKSGTSTLEYALLGVPMVIIYKASAITAFIGRRVLKIPHIGLVNIVAQEEVAPELWQESATGNEIARRTLQILENPDTMAAMKEKMDAVRDKIGGPGASRRAAEAIAKSLSERIPSPQAS